MSYEDVARDILLKHSKDEVVPLLKKMVRIDPAVYETVRKPGKKVLEAILYHLFKFEWLKKVAYVDCEVYYLGEDDGVPLSAADSTRFHFYFDKLRDLGFHHLRVLYAERGHVVAEWSKHKLEEGIRCQVTLRKRTRPTGRKYPKHVYYRKLDLQSACGKLPPDQQDKAFKVLLSILEVTKPVVPRPRKKS